MSNHYLPIETELAWFDNVAATDGIPCPCGEYQMLSNVTPDRIIHSRKTEDGVSWLMQSGEGSEARFAWVKPMLVKARATCSPEYACKRSD